MAMQRPGSGAVLREVEPRQAIGPMVVQVVSCSRLFSEGLVALLRSQMPEIDLWADAEAGGEPQVLLIDGGGDLATTVAHIRAQRSAHPSALIMVVELNNLVDDVVACIEAGAGCYTVRGDGSDALVEALRLLCSGRAACSPEVTARIFARLAAAHSGSPPVEEPGPALTVREREILGYLAADFSNQQIATSLVIEVRTVKHHVHNILAKLRARHRWQAVAVAHAQGLIDQPQP